MDNLYNTAGIQLQGYFGDEHPLVLPSKMEMLLPVEKMVLNFIIVVHTLLNLP